MIAPQDKVDRLKKDGFTDSQIVACAIFDVARALILLGNAEAATEMGAIESLAKEVRDGFDSLSGAISLAVENLP